MKVALPLAAALAFTAHAHAQSSQAKPDCAPYEKILAAVASQLTPLKGAVRSDGAFQPTVSLAGDCVVQDMDDGRLFTCQRFFGSEVEAREAFSASWAEAKRCIEGWREQELNTLPEEIVAGATLLESGPNPDSRFGILLSKAVVNGKTQFRVGVTMVWNSPEFYAKQRVK